MSYDHFGSRTLPYTQAQREADMARIAKQDEDRARSRRAWDRLCGSVAPIGGPSGSF